MSEFLEFIGLAKKVGWPLAITFGVSFLVTSISGHSIYNKLVQNASNNSSPTSKENRNLAEVPEAQNVAPATISQEPVWLPHIETERFVSKQWIEPISLETVGTANAQHIKLIEKETGKHQADFVIVRLYEGSYWLSKKSDKLYQGDRRPIDLDSKINTEQFAELVSKSEKVLGIGLSSSIGERLENEQLSLQRAKKICGWLESSGKLGTASCVPAPLGQALTRADEGTDQEINQRSALIVGITRQNPLIAWDSLYNELLARTNASNIDLNDYSATKSINIED